MLIHYMGISGKCCKRDRQGIGSHAKPKPNYGNLLDKLCNILHSLRV